MSYPKYQILIDAFDLLIERDGPTSAATSLKGQVSAHMAESLRNTLIDAACAGLDARFRSVGKMTGSTEEILNEVTKESFDWFDHIVKQDTENKENGLVFTLADQDSKSVQFRLREIMSLLYIVDSFKEDLAKCMALRVSGADSTNTGVADDKAAIVNEENLLRLGFKLDIEQAKLRRDLIIQKVYQLSLEDIKLNINVDTYAAAVERFMILDESDIEDTQRLLASIVNASDKTKVLITEPLDVDFELEASVDGSSSSLKAVGSKWDKFAADTLFKKNLVLAYNDLVQSLIAAGMQFDLGEIYTNEVIDRSATFITNKFSIIISVSGGLLIESRRIKIAEDILNQKFKGNN